MALARSAERRVGNFDTKSHPMAVWALTRRDRLKDAWNFFGYSKRIGRFLDPVYFVYFINPLLMECEQRVVVEHEIALLKGVEGAAGIKGNNGAEMGLGAATKRVAAMRLQM